MDITFSCGCGQHIVIDAAAAGQLVDCPKCGKPLKVPYKAKPVSPPAPTSPTPSKPFVPSPAQYRPSNRSVSKRLRVVVVLMLVAVFIFLARRLFTSPTLDGEAFLVMKSLDVKKLADLKVYLLRDPSAALAEINKAVTDQYGQVRKSVVQSDPAARDLEGRITGLKTELASLDGEKQKKLAATNRNLDATLKQLSAELESLKSNRLDVENQVTALEQQPDRAEYEKLKRARSEIEARYAPAIQQAEAEVNSAERAHQDYVSRALAAGAKLINDHILARNLTVDLVPKDGRFKEGYSSAYNYKSEIFEWDKEYDFRLKDKPGCLAVALPKESEYSTQQYMLFTKFPSGLTDQTLRQTFITHYQAYARQRFALEAAWQAANKKLTATSEERRLALQKFDYQNGTRMQSLESHVQTVESQLTFLKTKLDSLIVAISGKEAVLNKPLAEQLASLRAEIEKSFADRRAAIEKEITSAEAGFAPLIADALSREWTRIKDSAESEMAKAIGGKIVASATADGDGKYAFRPPSTGEFVVYATTQTGNEQQVFWFEKVKIRHGKTTIKLSNSNSYHGRLADLVLSPAPQNGR